MVHMFWGIITIILWGLAFIFLLLTLFFINTRRFKWVLVAMTVLFAVLPFWIIPDYQKYQLEAQERFIGWYGDAETGSYLQLHEDLTWTSDTSMFECNKGTWRFIITEDMSFLELEGICTNARTHLQIYEPQPDLLTFRPDQNRAGIKPKLELIRNN
jgi:uncharacterized cupin superfamily protein